MGYPDWVIFQRTESGRAEIRSKERGLTQSERLVLIIADGVSSYAALRGKLKSLARERFDRAVRKLTDKGLLYEVMFPEEGQQPDTVDPELMDRFLRQEDGDPVSIISFDPEEEHGEAGLDQESTDPVDPLRPATQAPASLANKEAGPEPAAQPASVSRPVTVPAVAAGTAKTDPVFPESKPRPQTSLPPNKPHWSARLRLNSSYVLLFAGISLICAPLLARFMLWLMM